MSRIINYYRFCNEILFHKLYCEYLILKGWETVSKDWAHEIVLVETIPDVFLAVPNRSVRAFLERTQSTVCSRGTTQRNSCPLASSSVIAFMYIQEQSRATGSLTNEPRSSAQLFPGPIVSHSLSRSDLLVPPLRLTANCFSQLIIEFAAGPGRRLAESSSRVKGRKNTPTRERAHAALLSEENRDATIRSASKAHLYTSDVSWNKAKCVFLLLKGSERGGRCV